ncbi:MAG: heme ABC transporter permease [Pseudomonadales bacterium]|nr:heme ABC transporter permease [Pseudomonadales bacterium]
MRSGKMLPWLGFLTVVLLSAGLVWGLLLAPSDYQQGQSVRIMYVHVPAAILAQSSYVMMAVAALVALVWRIKIADAAVQTAAPIGAMMTLLALATGSLWGKPMWGTFWIWDARLTSTLILFFLFVGVLALRSASGRGRNAGRAASVLALIGLINLPVIKYSVDWWFTLHQPASFTLTERPAMPVEMWAPLLVMVLGFYSWFAFTWILRLRLEVLQRESRADWVQRVVSS